VGDCGPRYAALAERRARALAIASRDRRGVHSRKAANERAVALVPIVRELRGNGIVTLQAIANELNKRKVATVYGGRWHPTSVARLLKRLPKARGPMV
jgi:hypothetical protein